MYHRHPRPVLDVVQVHRDDLANGTSSLCFLDQIMTTMSESNDKNGWVSARALIHVSHALCENASEGLRVHDAFLRNMSTVPLDGHGFEAGNA